MTLIRASVGERPSAARATLEDYGMLARALLHLGVVTGEARYAVAGRELVDATLAEVPTVGATGEAGSALPFTVPGGADPVLAGHGVAIQADPSEGAYASGSSAMAAAAHQLYLLTAKAEYLAAARGAMERFAPLAVTQPVGFGAALTLMVALTAPAAQLVVVGDTVSAMATRARGWYRSGGVTTVLTDAAAASFADAGFELFQARTAQPDPATGEPAATAYLCRDFVCRLPLIDPSGLANALREGA